MTAEARVVLDEFLQELGQVKVNKSPAGEAKKKPLLLLLVLAMIKHGELSENRILFTDIEKRLTDLITRFGGRATESGAKPEQPFYHLRTSAFWELSVPGGLPRDTKKTIAKSVLSAPGAFAQLRPAVFDLMRCSSTAHEEAVTTILRRWWNNDDAKRLRSDLRL